MKTEYNWMRFVSFIPVFVAIDKYPESVVSHNLIATI